MIILDSIQITFILTCFFSLTQIPRVFAVYIIDKNTAKELPIETHTYYAIQNQKTQRFLIWYGKNATLDAELDQNQGKFWHIFEKINNSYHGRNDWYKMYHHFGSHIVKLASSHTLGYYQIFNKDCFVGEHPNRDGVYQGDHITCNVVDSGNLTDFNWKFIKKQDQSEPGSSSSTEQVSKSQVTLKIIIPVVTIVSILAAIVYLLKRRKILFNKYNIGQVFYTQDNIVNQQAQSSPKSGHTTSQLNLLTQDTQNTVRRQF